MMPAQPSFSGRSTGFGSALLPLGRIALAGVFLYAAYTKLLVVHLSPLHIEWRPWMLFAFSVNSYQILPEWAVTLVARTAPWFELVLGVLLLAGYGLRYVAAGASALLLFFFGVMVRAHFKGLGIDCGCFGFGEKLGIRTLVRDGLLVLFSLVVTAAAFLRRRRPGSMEGDTGQGSAQPVRP